MATSTSTSAREDTFLKDNCPYEGSAVAIPGSTTVVISGVPPGEYAAQVFHDEHDEGKVRRTVLGIPTEGIGFSNDAPRASAWPEIQGSRLRGRAQPSNTLPFASGRSSDEPLASVLGRRAFPTISPACLKTNSDVAQPEGRIVMRQGVIGLGEDQARTGSLIFCLARW